MLKKNREKEQNNHHANAEVKLQTSCFGLHNHIKDRDDHAKWKRQTIGLLFVLIEQVVVVR